jgi:transcription termination/antitermination protein NusG
MSTLLYRSWFAVQSASRCEHKAADILAFKGYECFLPLYQASRKWSDRTKKVALPLFPGYLFCRMEHTAAGLVLTTPGTIRIVSFGGQPYPISDAEIEAVRRMCSSGGASPFPYFKKGESVRIKDGPLAGIIGVLKEIRNQQRLIVTVDFIMKSVAVEIDAFEIERLPTSHGRVHAG